MIINEYLTDDDKEQIKLEKEHNLEMKKLNNMINCDCGYKAIGKNIKEKINDMYEHIKQKHPEKKPMKL